MTKKDIWDLITGIRLSFISIVGENYSTVNDKSSGSILDPCDQWVAKKISDFMRKDNVRNTSDV